MECEFFPGWQDAGFGSDDKTIRLWDLKFFYEVKDVRLSEEKVKQAEQTFNLKLVNLTLQSIQPDRNLYGVNPKPPQWTQTHPFHWLSKAEAGNAEAMVELGIIYDRGNELDKAVYWYTQAIKAGSERAKERMKIFRQWLTLHKDEYPEAYGKYGTLSEP